ncbi:NB-ARC domain-containing protein [Frankia torreyi]|uniref:NB-ARC domain-containing protein n=1 Tax=Frankia torreyi TaxID=1856 RepID=A0A0D8BJE4_9ACTN|nr:MULTISPECIES: FxSxx-COOH system tetratricopeptide repeat protein [Frankia]KJE24368.1 NB-ARC domain-containing protein [Frankia torreyi]
MSVEEARRGAPEHLDFFISYAPHDRPWAEWIAWQLTYAEDFHYRVELDVWDWPAGRNWIDALSTALARADRVLAIYSPAYFDPARNSVVEWSEALCRDEEGRDRLLPVRIEAVEVPPVLRSRIHVDLFGLDHATTKRRLLEAARGPSRPDGEPVFPPQQVPPPEPAGTEPRLPGSLPEIWNLPDRNPDFVGRDNLLVELRARLLSTGTSTAQVIHGMGGVGKTQLSVEYAHRHAGDYDLAWWVDAEQPELFIEKLAGLTERLKESDRSAQRLVDADGRLLDGVRWLLILDNAEDSDAITRWPLTGGSGHTIITSRNPHGHGGVGGRLEVKELSRSEAIALVQSRAGDVKDDEAERLAHALGDLPLALAQAAAFLHETGETTERYLTLLRSRAIKIMSQGRQREYGKTLAASWKISMERLEGQDPAAVELLYIAAFLAPEPIPFELFKAGRVALPALLAELVADDLDFPVTRGLIGRYSLARIERGTLQLHRIVQALIRDRLGEDPGKASRMRWTVQAILVAARPGDPTDPASWDDYRRLLPHLLAADLGSSEDAGCRDLLLDTISYLIERGETDIAHRLVGDAFRRWKHTTEPDDSHRLAVQTTLARTYTDLGRYQEAFDLDQDVHRRLLARLGNDHPATLAAASDMAAGLNRLGRVEEARRLDEETFTTRRAILGEDHPDTLTSANNLAADLWWLGHHEEARALDQKTLDQRREALGADHPDTLTSASNLAADLRRLGQYEDALGLDDEVRTRRLEALGPDHPGTLMSASNLASDLTNLGRHNDARDLYEETVIRSRRVLGDCHPTTLGVVENLAYQLNRLGEHDRARALDEETFEGRRVALGDDHPETLRSADNLAGDLRRAGEYEAARKLDEQTLLGRRKILGDEHPETILSNRHLAMDVDLLGQAWPPTRDVES